jgi:tubulin polyglutamylase TTLL6/13
VRLVLKKLSWKEVGDDDEWQLYWTDTSVSMERILRLSKTQKINHFCGMLEICRKKKLSNNIAHMQKVAPVDFEFHPQTFNLPDDMEAFMEVFKTKKKKTYILKPDAGCQVRLRHRDPRDP